MSLSVDAIQRRFTSPMFRAEEKNVLSSPNKDESPTTKQDYTPLVTAGLALASLGIATAGFFKNSNVIEKANANKAEIENATKQMIEDAIKNLQKDLPSLPKDFSTEISLKLKLLEEKLKNIVEPDELNRVNTDISRIASEVHAENYRRSINPMFNVRGIVVNGRDIIVAAPEVEHARIPQDKIKGALRTESLNRILGIGSGLKEIPKAPIIRITTSEVTPYAKTGGMAVVPKEIADNLAKELAGNKDAKVILDIPMYEGRIGESTWQNLYKDEKTGALQYRKLIADSNVAGGYKEEIIADNLELVDTMNIPIYPDKDIVNETVKIYKAEQKVFLDYDKIVSEMSDKTREQVENALSKNGIYETKGLFIGKDKEGKNIAYAKVDSMLYNNRKFNLDIPDGANKSDYSPYSDIARSTGETERFMYFAKYFYESLFDASIHNNKPKADLIIGNDWQTGAISALIRQETTMRKLSSGANPKAMDKLQNTPIITIMHNINYTGNVWHSQPKMMNILFGEDAATILGNSYMPNTMIKGKSVGLDSKLQNGLLVGVDVNPQMMAAAYSDKLVGVSERYTKECVESDIFGKALRPIFALRARHGAYKEENVIKEIISNTYKSAIGEGENSLTITKPNITKLAASVKDKKTMLGIANGCDKANNTLKNGTKRGQTDWIAKELGLPEGTFRAYVAGEDSLKWHNDMKMASINKAIADINLARKTGGKENPMKIELPEMTDLTGVNENTPIFVSAGRITDQKGLDIFAASIEEYLTKYHKEGQELPVFYVQGIGGDEYKEMILKIKKQVAQTNKKAADRIVFANLFSENGRYDAAKMMSDFTVMSSWFEPCGLVHKEIGLYSGAIPVVTNTGGLPEELVEGKNVIISKFKPKKGDKATKEELEYNSKNFAAAIDKAVQLFNNKTNFKDGIDTMMNSNFDWTKPNGAMSKYMNLMKELNVFTDAA